MSEQDDNIKATQKEIDAAEAEVKKKREEEITKKQEEQAAKQKELEELLKQAEEKGAKQALQERKQKEKEQEIEELKQTVKDLKEKSSVDIDKIKEEIRQSISKEFKPKSKNNIPTKDDNPFNQPQGQSDDPQRIIEDLKRNKDKFYEVDIASEDAWDKYQAELKAKNRRRR